MLPLFRLLSLAALLAAAAPLVAAQEPAPAAPRLSRIVGHVRDATNGDPIAGAQVAVDGTQLAARSDLSGRYTILNVAPGRYTLTVRMIGYAAKSITGVTVNGEPAELDVTLSASAIQVAAIEVTAEVERGSVSRALEEQRSSNQMMSSVTAEQIKKSPDSDASQAVQRVSGVTVQDGKFVFVRGLGERYTTTSLNGTRIPSAEPERRVVPLDLFPTGLLEGITTSKTFTPDQPGDFSGAQVNLRTRQFLGGSVLQLSTSVGFNSAAYARAVPHAPVAGMEWLGIAGSARALPAVARAAGNLTNLSQTDLNQVTSSFRNAWTTRLQEGAPNGSFSASLGGEDPVFGRLLSYVGSLTYSYGQEVRQDERRALAQPGSVLGTFDRQNVYRGGTGRTSALWGGMLNLSTGLGETSRLSFSNTVTHSGDNEAMRLAGFNNGLNEYLDLTRLTFTERHVRSHQLKGEHLVGGRHGLDWAAALSAVRRREPDRSDLAYQTTVDAATGESAPYAWYGASRSATKTFSDVDENGYQGSANYRHVLGSAERPAAIKVGLYYHLTERDADTRAFDILNVGLTDQERRQSAQAIFDGTYAQQGKFYLAANAALGRYSATDHLAAGYAQLELSLSRRLRLIGGMRVERSRLQVRSTTFDLGDTTTVLRNTDFLPSLAFMLQMGEDHNLRLSGSQTLARPEYRELSPTPYFDVLGGQSLRGNPELQRSLIQNVDVRWEWYPTPGQVLSVALFAKRFERPIERILIQRSDGNEPEATYANANAARNYGVEVEMRRNLGLFGTALAPFTVFANATLMNSDIQPGNDSLSSLTNASRPMVGQAEYVVNAGLTFSGSSALSATVLYNVVGPRIHEAAIYPLPDVYEHERHMIDVSLQLPFLLGTSMKIDAKNVLDAPFQLTQGTVERHYYRTGRVFSVGLSWQP